MPKVATANHPLLRPLLIRRQRAMREPQARARLEKLRQLFVQARDGRDANQCVLWVRGYRVTPKEAEEGFLGHYVQLRLVEQPRGWIIEATKKDMPLAQHPERVRSQGNLPNWGYPVMRSIRNARVFASEAEAKAHLQQLIDAFPKACKLSAEAVRVRVYGKHPEFGVAMDGVLVTVRPASSGEGYVLSAVADPSAPAQRLRQREQQAQSDDGERKELGEFARKVMAGKKKAAPLPGFAQNKERRNEAVRKALGKEGDA